MIRFGSDITPQLQHMNSSKLYSEDTVDESSLGDKSVGSLGASLPLMPLPRDN